MNKNRIAVIPGSFDPITLGHKDIAERAAKIFDKVYVAVMANSEKTTLFSAEERVDMCRRVFADDPDIEVVTASTLTTQLAKELGAATLVKGVRDEKDCSYEMLIASVNATLDCSIDTIFIPSKHKYSLISSSVVKELLKYGADLKEYLPECIIGETEAKYRLL